MLNIAICDDVEEIREQLVVMLTQLGSTLNVKFKPKSFSSGEELCKGLETNYYDIILLDIFMGGIDGIEVANKLRVMGENSLIIFISNDDKRWRELFGFRTIDFIDKPVNEIKLNNALKKAIDILKKDEEELFLYKKGRDIIYIPLKDIKYFSSYKNTITMYTTKGNEVFYEKLFEIWERINYNNNFIMPHRSYIFNLSFVNMTSKNVILKETKDLYNIGNGYKKETEKRYLQYVERRIKH